MSATDTASFTGCTGMSGCAEAGRELARCSTGVSSLRRTFSV